MLNTGIKISEYPDGPLDNSTNQNKLLLNHYFISYAPSHYGTKFINKNYKVSIQSLRNDLTGHIGVNNVKGKYKNYIDIWSGYWIKNNVDENGAKISIDRVNSYVFEWPDNLRGSEDYIVDKFNKAKNEKLDKIFILRSAPLPLESEDVRYSSEEDNTLGKDPDPHSAKLVTKNYIDDRHSGFRKVYESSANLSLRPYTCYYQYSNLIKEDAEGIRTINICDDTVLEDGKTFYDKVKRNRLIFFVRIANREEYYKNSEGKHFNNLRFLVNGEKDVIRWSYENEFTEILRESRIRKNNDGEQMNKNKDFIFIRFEAEYIDEKFTVSATNFFGRGKHSTRMIEMIPDSLGKVEKIDLSLHENESFITQIPQDSVNDSTAKQISISFDTSKLNDYHEYVWNYYVITPDKTDEKYYDNTIFDNTCSEIVWAMSENFAEAPILEPNRLYCFEFVKAFDDVLIGRIKYYINLIKKN